MPCRFGTTARPIAIAKEADMHGIYRFLKSTTIGGLAVLLPLAVLLGIVVWAVQMALTVLMPLFKWLPDTSVGGVSLTLVAAILGMVICCFLAGIVAETTLARSLGGKAERLAMFVPGYAVMKNVGANLIGVEGKNPLRTVLVRFEASWQLGFLMETLADGRHAVFVPNVPNALAGQLHICTTDQVHVLAMSVSTALDVFSCLGNGLRATWSREPAATLASNVAAPHRPETRAN
jgi:uncharacterized membrane protein